MDLSEGIGAIATLIAALVAWRISENWRNQKSSEVLANESKDVVKNILESSKILKEINFNLTLRPTKDLELELREEVVKFYSFNTKMIRDLLLINSSIQEEDLYGLILKYDECFKTLKMIIDGHMKCYGMPVESQESKREEWFQSYIQTTSKISKILIQYALYVKPINVKKQINSM